MTSSEMAAACFEGFGYAEAHIYGRLTIADIARVVFTRDRPDTDLVERLLDNEITPVCGVQNL